jgi:hypothetical protein
MAPTDERMPAISQPPSRPPKPGRKTRGRRLAGTLLAIVAATVVIELALRMLVVSPNPTITDPSLGRLMKPNTHYRQSIEGYSAFSTNALGFNDAPIAAGETNAVLVLGDSFIEAEQVEPADNFAADFRRDHPDQAIIAAGRAGLSPLAYEYLARYVAGHAGVRDIVVVLNHSDLKDITTSGVEIQRDASGQVVGLANWEQRRPEGADADAFRYLVSHSAIFAQINGKFIDALKDRAAALRAWIRHPMSLGTPIKATPQPAAVDPGDAALADKQVADIVAYMLTRLKLIAPVQVVFIPLLEFHSGRDVDERAESAEARQAFTCAAALSKTPLLVLNDALIARYKATGQPPFGFANSVPGNGHLNVAGHELLAEAITDSLTHPQVPEAGCSSNP